MLALRERGNEIGLGNTLLESLELVLHRKVPAGTRVLYASLSEGSYSEITPTISVFSTKGEAKADALKRFDAALENHKEMIDNVLEDRRHDRFGPGYDSEAESDDDEITNKFPIVVPPTKTNQFVPKDFPAKRRSKFFRKKRGIDFRYAKFTHGSGLFGAVVRSSIEYSCDDPELDEAFWVEELKIEAKFVPTTKKAAKPSAAKAGTSKPGRVPRL